MSRRTWPRRFAACALALASLQIFAAGRAAGAERADTRITQLGLERWTRDSGLPANWVRDITQTQDGFLWIATPEGLARFDGRRIHTFTVASSPELGASSIAALAPGSGNTLWIGLEFGGVRRLRNGVIESDPRLDALRDDAVIRCLFEDAAGTLWIGTSRGLWRVDGGRARIVAPDEESKSAEVNAITSHDGVSVWVRTDFHGIWHIRSGRFEVVPDAPECQGRGIAAGPDGVRFTSCRDGVWRLDRDAEAWREISPARGTGRIFTDSRGDLWFSSEDGLHRWRRGRLETLPPDKGLGDWRLRAFFEDREGSLWFGTYSGGLTRLREGAVRAFGEPEGLTVGSATAVLASADGTIWVGGFRRDLVRWDPASGVIRSFGPRDGLPGDTAWAFAEDPRHPAGLWVGTDGGLVWLEENRLQRIGPGGIEWRDPARVIYRDPEADDTLWIAGWTGTVQIRPGGHVVHEREDGAPMDRIRVFHRDRTGRLLAGGNDGLFVLEGDHWSPVDLGEPRPRGVTAILEDEDGTIWLSSGTSGLLRWTTDGVSRYGAANGLPFSSGYNLRNDRVGGFWISGNDGLLRFRLEDHARWRRGEIDVIPFEVLGRRDGLRDTECNGWGRPASSRLADGTLVYPTISGVVLVDPERRPALDLTPDEIYVEGAWTGARPLPLDDELRLTQDDRSLRIRFSAIELLRPEAVSFRYRLEDFDERWIPASDVTEANWARVDPGRYRFRLQARLPGQEWVESSGELLIAVQPHYWETGWFRGLLGVLLVSFVAAFFLWRVRLANRFAAAIASERTFLRSVIDVSPNPIFVRRADGTYSLANRAAADIYGLAPTDLEGRSPDAIDGRLSGMDEIDALDEDVIRTGSEQVVPEEAIVDHAGRQRWFRIVKRPGFGPADGTVEHVFGSAVDVTDFKLAELQLREEQNRLQQSREEARRLSRQILRVQEDERQRLAREIHDDITQRLAGLSMLAMSTRQSLSRDPALDVGNNLEELARDLAKITNDLQTLSHELHSGDLEELGVAEALRSECETFAGRTGLDIRFAADGPRREPPASTTLALFRITQEALRNCLTHADARQVSVRLSGSDDEIVLEIRDDGVGFDPESSIDRQGLGLASMKERSRLVGGELRVESAKGKGTRVVVRVPVS